MSDEVSSRYFNLEKASILVLDADMMSRAIISQILLGFGARHIHKCSTLEEARGAAQLSQYDLFIVDPSSKATDGYEFVSWLRRKGTGGNRFAPVLVVTGHTQRSRIGQARDCGANFVVAKPLSPAILYERIIWMARERRPHVECKIYAGPDRRWKEDGPQEGAGRREGDSEPADVAPPASEPVAGAQHAGGTPA